MWCHSYRVLGYMVCRGASNPLPIVEYSESAPIKTGWNALIRPVLFKWEEWASISLGDPIKHATSDLLGLQLEWSFYIFSSSSSSCFSFSSSCSSSPFILFLFLLFYHLPLPFHLDRITLCSSVWSWTHDPWASLGLLNTWLTDAHTKPSFEEVPKKH